MGTTNFECGNLYGIENFIPSIMTELRPGSSPVQGLKVNLGNCSVTAATNLVSYYAEKRGFSNLKINQSRKAMYDEFVKLSGFKTYIASSANHDQEGLNNLQINSAISKYVKNSGYKYSSDNYWLNYWSDWKRDIDNGYPVYTALSGMKNVNNQWTEVGHAVIAVGYREYQANGERFLRVLDGWNRTSDRYIFFSITALVLGVLAITDKNDTKITGAYEIGLGDLLENEVIQMTYIGTQPDHIVDFMDMEILGNLREALRLATFQKNKIDTRKNLS